MEIWKDIDGYEGYYQISNFGNIKSLKRKVNTRGNGFRQLNEKVIRPLMTSSGYLNVIASREQKRQTFIIHHLVAQYFLGNKPEKCVIDHIDGNKLNNHVSNLKYVSPAENSRKRYDAKLTLEKAIEIRRLCKTQSQNEIAKIYGITQTMVSRIYRNKAWVNA